jgi:hypothetical protein
MNRILFAVLVGAGLGVLDGLTAYFTPEVRNELLGIVIGSTIKGALAGVLIGLFARKVASAPAVVLFGLAVGAFFAYLIARMQGSHYLEIILPGSLVGLLTGFATVRYARPIRA